ncbi:hypothetical protein Ga0100230_010880 [Opitutaceae bacterium TAV3]|nr:hypothetical protein Ga0100230_010880 [Opitutaceae bacterium TAV3]
MRTSSRRTTTTRSNRSRGVYVSDYGYGGFAPYVPVAERRAKAAKEARKAAKNGKPLSPVNITGKKISTTFWGNAWCQHLESFSDYANRLPRGRTYVRNGSVIDLQIVPGRITAQVMGSQLYRQTITIAPLAPARWDAIKQRCAGNINSLVDLLKGRLSDGVMQVITDRKDGLFPAPSEIKMECTCPDMASLCKHLAAVLYGVGARLDTQPELLFTLRGVDHMELLAAATTGAVQIGADTSALAADQLGDVFGIEIDPGAPTPAPVATPAPAQAAARKRPPQPPSKRAGKKPVTKKPVTIKNVSEAKPSSRPRKPRPQ